MMVVLMVSILKTEEVLDQSEAVINIIINLTSAFSSLQELEGFQNVVFKLRAGVSRPDPFFLHKQDFFTS